MTTKKWLYLYASIILFLGLIGMAVFNESTYFLYAASALPILIVIFLPDRDQAQYIPAKRSKNKKISITKQAAGGEATLSIAFPAGYVQWKRSKLYFHLDSITEAEAAGTSEARSASLSVLPFDLSVHPRKQGWIGIDLAQMAERTRGLAYTTDEVNRFVIRMSDLEQAALQMSVASKVDAAASTAANNKTLQA
ncbi:hypothetical protein [Paenibacillus cremeus]|uniref:hypothetical protein n=1 Tax=Paenibacillus cremeus TaxID=2163881 RepID=UPI0016463E35|nr:hypothetical protein [Paenibacillus cremeus]